MKAFESVGQRSERRQANRTLAVCTGLVVFLGFLRAEGIENLAPYLLVVLAALLPVVLWVRGGALGIPVLPAFALLHLVYFAVPMLRGRSDLMEYGYSELLIAAATVGLFLLSASVTAQWMSGRPQRKPREQLDLFSARQMISFTFLGLGLGLVYRLAILSGALGGFGAFFGLVRSIVLTALGVACFFLGVARARGLLRGPTWAGAILGFGLVILLSWSSFFLIGGAAHILAAGLGYVITKKRVPWLVMVVMFIVVSVLHAGKEEMREKYWQQGRYSNAVTSVTQLPGLVVEWVGAGIRGLSSGAERRSAIDRASLLQMLLRAQRLTPEVVDFLGGESYALLPGMLVPRFVSSGKTGSGASMDLLNIRYGLLTMEGTSSTAIGWGLIAEAWANFGYYGEIGIGLLVGLLSGALTRSSAGASAVSRPALFAITAMITLLNLEADLAGLVTSLFQSLAAVLIFFAIFQFLSGRRRFHPGLDASRASSARAKV